MIVTRSGLAKFITNQIKEDLFIQEMKILEKSLRPYFQEVIEEENRKFRQYLLAEGHFELYEDLIFEEKLIKEGILSTVADIGITAGQMIGGGVGQVAGLAGLAKYAPEFQNNIDKSFLEWFGPFISLFFSVQALVFPMPAIGSLKTIMIGFAKGLKSVLAGAAKAGGKGLGLIGKGVMALLQKGWNFVQSAVGLMSKGISGVLKAIKAGGEMITKIASKIGGAAKLSKLTASIQTAGQEVLKRLGILKEGMKALGKEGAKDTGKATGVLQKAFSTSKDKLDDALNAIKGAGSSAKAGLKKGVSSFKGGASALGSKGLNTFKDGIMKATQGGRDALGKWIRDYMSKNVDKMTKVLEPLKGRDFGQMGVFKGLTSGGAFKFAAAPGTVLGGNMRGAMTMARSNKVGTVYIDKVLTKKIFSNFITTIGQIKDPLIAILLQAFKPFMPRVGIEAARVAAASQGGGFDEYMNTYTDSASKKAIDAQISASKTAQNIQESIINDWIRRGVIRETYNFY